jgi:RNA polymerase primary sigma factor
MRALKITNTITSRDQKSMERYLNEIAKYEVLTPEEELSLFKRFKVGDERAFEKLILHNLRFVVSVSKKYQHLGLKLGDLINEGNIGLIKAAKRFDETKGFKFISYAVWWIRQSILQAVNDKGRKIKLPVNMSGDTAKIMDAIRSFQQQEERQPTLQELASFTDFKLGHVKRCLETYKKCSSIDAPIKEDEYTPLASLMEDTKIKQPDFELSVRDSQKIEAQQLLRKLPPRQATILEYYFGLGNTEAKTLSDIGDMMEISRERVRQIKDRALRRLRRVKEARLLTVAS